MLLHWYGPMLKERSYTSATGAQIKGAYTSSSHSSIRGAITPVTGGQAITPAYVICPKPKWHLEL